MTLPGPLREGDAHFMDRGAPGLYLGPSEEGQCHIVYVFALRRVLPTAKLRVWEDQFPGLRGHRYAWFPRQARPVFLQLLKLLHGYSKHPVADIQD